MRSLAEWLMLVAYAVALALYLLVAYQILRILLGGSWGLAETTTALLSAVIAHGFYLHGKTERLSGRFEQFEKRFERMEGGFGAVRLELAGIRLLLAGRKRVPRAT